MKHQTITFGPCQITFDDRVLEPRQWTVMQSRWAATLAQNVGPGAILELCSGAGQIGLAAAVWSGRDLIQVDLDPVACDFARENSSSAGIADRVEVRCGPIDHSLHDDERFALVLADPPYLPTATIDRFPDDPPLSIDGGTDGLDLARSCVAAIGRSLMDGGAALLQLAGAEQFRVIEADLPGGLTLEEVREVDPERAVGLIRRSASSADQHGADQAGAA